MRPMGAQREPSGGEEVTLPAHAQPLEPLQRFDRSPATVLDELSVPSVRLISEADDVEHRRLWERHQEALEL